MIGVLNEALAERLVLAERARIAREDAYEVFASGAVAAPHLLYKWDAFLRPDEAAVAFTVELMQKDPRLVLALVDEVGVDSIAVRAADDTLARADELGMANETPRAQPSSAARGSVMG